MKRPFTTVFSNSEKIRSFLIKRMNHWVDQKENGYMDV
jgi:hypothetical protein